jgi:hypothetical protein
VVVAHEELLGEAPSDIRDDGRRQSVHDLQHLLGDVEKTRVPRFSNRGADELEGITSRCERRRLALEGRPRSVDPPLDAAAGRIVQSLRPLIVGDGPL